MCDCERSTYVQSFVCMKCLSSFEVTRVKTCNENMEKCFQKRGMHHLFLAARSARANN